jgi:hypothetical protein
VIAKRIASPKGSSGFTRLAAYVVNARAGVDPASWERLDAYIRDVNGHGEKVAWARVTNCASPDPGWAAKEIAVTQARNRRAGPDRQYHLVVSFPEGERPTREQLENIEDRLCEALGYGEHQRISAVHQNTENWHLHVAINKVHPGTFRNATPIGDHYRLQAACAELEVRHGLTREPHTVDRGQTAERRERRTRGRAADFEAQTGAPAFQTWVRQHAGAALLAARDSGRGWPELHRVAAGFGLTVKLRGAGLVIGHQTESRLHVKASSIDRSLSLKSLAAVLGPFEAPEASVESTQPHARYELPRCPAALFGLYGQERAAAERARDAALAALRARHRAYAEQLATYHADRRQQERAAGLRGVLRRESLRHLAEQRARDHAERRAREAAERQQARAQHPVPGWQAWLEARAAGGNEAALAALRARQQQRERIEAQIIDAADDRAARHVVHQHLRPAVRRDGRVVYRVADGGLVLDEARQVRVGQHTAGAAFLALTLAADRFGAGPLQVRGTEDFRRQVAQLAGAKGMRVRFADAELERERRRNATERQQNTAQQGR